MSTNCVKNAVQTSLAFGTVILEKAGDIFLNIYLLSIDTV